MTRQKKITPKKIVYLFGAGATHAEKLLQFRILKKGLNNIEEKKFGLLARHVSKRVFERFIETNPIEAQYYGITKYSIDEPSGFDILEHGDIELFISLVESLKTEISEKHAILLRRYFREDILKNIFINNKQIIPQLNSSLIELHELNNKKEKILGFLTLNYDPIFEKSFKIKKIKIDYGVAVNNQGSMDFTSKSDKQYLLLKLHGSFDWYLKPDINKISISSGDKAEDSLWIPPRLNKEYLNYPYNLIHGKAFELLRQCDILRIVGCSLNQNDTGLISLLFRTQKLRNRPYSIEIINAPNALLDIKKRLGLMFSFSESFYDNDKWEQLERNPDNPFLDWLYHNVINASDDSLRNTSYLKNVKRWINL